MTAGALNRPTRTVRFLTRLWIIIAVPWGLYAVFFLVSGGAGDSPADIAAVAGIALAIPIVIYALGAALLWAFRALWE
jgi:hypothetical protein